MKDILNIALYLFILSLWFVPFVYEYMPGWLQTLYAITGVLILIGAFTGNIGGGGGRYGNDEQN
jgi:hypothetical protein